jgi:hypothetical protein
MCLEYIKEQTYELCKIAVQKDGTCINYVKNQTNELCKLAISQHYSALNYIKNQTFEICKFAVSCNIDSYKYIKNKKIIIDIVKTNYHASDSVVFQKNDYMFVCPIFKEDVEKGFIIKSHINNNNICVPKYVLSEEAFCGFLKNNNVCYNCRKQLRVTDYFYTN